MMFASFWAVSQMAGQGGSFGQLLSGKDNSEVLSIAEVFHPWVRWEGLGSGFESLSGTGGVWKSGILPHLGLRSKKTLFSNGLANKRSNVSVKKSQIG